MAAETRKGGKRRNGAEGRPRLPSKDKLGKSRDTEAAGPKVRFGIRLKFALAIIALVAVVIVTMTLYFIRLQSSTLKAEIIKFAERETEHLTNAAQDAISAKDELSLVAAVKNVQKISSIRYVYIFENNNRIVQNFDLEKNGTLLEDDEITRKAKSNEKTDAPLMVDFPDPDDEGGVIYDFSRPVLHTFYKNRIATVRMGFSDKIIRDEVFGMTRNIMIISSFFLVAAVAGSIALSGIIIRPIRKLSRGAAVIGTGDLEYKIDLESGDELGQLAYEFNIMTEKLKKAKDVEIESRIMQEQLELAKEIQEGLNPMGFYDRDGLQIKGYTRAAKGVGGDYFDYLDISENVVGALISDVSGKGVPASLVMVMIRTVFTNSVKNNRNIDPATVVRSINDALGAEFAIDKFATLFFMIFNRKTEELAFSNAGHGPLFCYRASLNKCTVTNIGGVPIGITDDVEYEQARVRFNPGDIVVLYTDGITEMRNEEKEEYGKSRLQRLIMDNHNLNAQEIVEKIVTDVDYFRGNTAPHDDMTTLVMKRVV
jgi:sigma-B regulation protein RsbU (phosphoserine phosphatase)